MSDEHGTTATAEAQHPESGTPLTNPQPGLIIWTLVTFALLLVILRKLAWKPMLEMLDKREKSISDALSKSEQAKAEAEKILADQKAILAEARRDAQQLIERSRQDGERARARPRWPWHASSLKRSSRTASRLSIMRRRSLSRRSAKWPWTSLWTRLPRSSRSTSTTAASENR